MQGGGRRTGEGVIHERLGDALIDAPTGGVHETESAHGLGIAELCE